MITWKHTATETQTQREEEGVLVPEHGGFKVYHCSVEMGQKLQGFTTVVYGDKLVEHNKDGWYSKMLTDASD